MLHDIALGKWCRFHAHMEKENVTSLKRNREPQMVLSKLWGAIIPHKSLSSLWISTFIMTQYCKHPNRFTYLNVNPSNPSHSANNFKWLLS